VAHPTLLEHRSDRVVRLFGHYALTQHPVLGLQVFNNDELLAADPTGEQVYDVSKWRRFERHPESLAWRTRLCLNIGPTASSDYLDTTGKAIEAPVDDQDWTLES